MTSRYFYVSLLFLIASCGGKAERNRSGDGDVSGDGNGDILPSAGASGGGPTEETGGTTSDGGTAAGGTDPNGGSGGIGTGGSPNEPRTDLPPCDATSTVAHDCNELDEVALTEIEVSRSNDELTVSGLFSAVGDEHVSGTFCVGIAPQAAEEDGLVFTPTFQSFAFGASPNETEFVLETPVNQVPASGTVEAVVYVTIWETACTRPFEVVSLSWND